MFGACRATACFQWSTSHTLVSDTNSQRARHHVLSATFFLAWYWYNAQSPEWPASCMGFNIVFFLDCQITNFTTPTNFFLLYSMVNNPIQQKYFL